VDPPLFKTNPTAHSGRFGTAEELYPTRFKKKTH